jgi:hypothetical protein
VRRWGRDNQVHADFFSEPITDADGHGRANAYPDPDRHRNQVSNAHDGNGNAHDGNGNAHDGNGNANTDIDNADADSYSHPADSDANCSSRRILGTVASSFHERTPCKGELCGLQFPPEWRLHVHGSCNPGSGQWSIARQSEIALTANGQSIDCSFTVSATTFTTNCGSAGTVVYTRVAAPQSDFVATISENALRGLAFIVVVAAMIAGLIFLGKSPPPSRRRRA